jgi:hypothetical protein
VAANPDDVRDDAQRAIELLTAWVGGGRSNDFLAERVALLASEGPEAIARALVGLIGISGELLILLSSTTGQPEDEVLRQLALRYQAH